MPDLRERLRQCLAGDYDVERELGQGDPEFANLPRVRAVWEKMGLR